MSNLRSRGKLERGCDVLCKCVACMREGKAGRDVPYTGNQLAEQLQRGCGPGCRCEQCVSERTHQQRYSVHKF